MKITGISLTKTFDSRAQATVTITLTDDKGRQFHGDVPAGKSTGEREVKVLPFEKASRALKAIEPKLIGREFRTPMEFDRLLKELDGTADKSKLGGNLTLALSIAMLRAIAEERAVEPWQVIREEYFAEEKNGNKPLIFSNLINGGAHAMNGLDVQEYMVVVRPGRSMGDTVQGLIEFYKELGDLLKKKTKARVPIGDEGGYACAFKDNTEPITILDKLIAKKNLKSYDLALDVAASNFLDKGKYNFGGKKLSAAEMGRVYANFIKKAARLVSIEDPFGENDIEGWKEFKPGSWVIGDDLTTTNPGEINLHAEYISGVIIKPNQIGTVSESAEAIATAKKNRLKTIVSHRSGETGDVFIIHLAKGAGADAVKIGAPIRERIIKFNELVRLYD